MKKSNHYPKIKINFLLVVFLLLVFRADYVFAAELFFKPQTQEARQGDYLQVDLYLMPEEESVNAIEGKIIFPNDLLDVKEIIDGDSVVGLWTKKPLFDEGVVKFGGVMPGGFEGILDPFKKGYQPGKILSLIFRTKENGKGIINIDAARALLNDGLGTLAPLSVTPFEFQVAKDAPAIEGVVPLRDPNPPEPFNPLVTNDSNVFGGQWFLVFVSQDKESGIARYEVIESKNQNIKNKEWKVAESPYLLSDQKLQSYIFVRAIDKAGNERIAIVQPRNRCGWYESRSFSAMIILIIVLLLIPYFIYVRKKYKHK